MLKLIKQLLERNARYIAIFITLLIAFLSLVSLKDVTTTNISNSDKIGHVLAYFTLGLSWFYVYKHKSSKIYFIALLLIIYGIILEGLQGTITSYRTADFYDFIANTTGVILAIILFSIGYKK